MEGQPVSVHVEQAEKLGITLAEWASKTSEGIEEFTERVMSFFQVRQIPQENS